MPLRNTLWARTSLAGFGLFFVLGGFAFRGYRPAAASAQPLAYNHAKHIENGLSCTDCHAGAQTEARATLPDLALCLGCHETALGNSAEERKIRDAKAAGRPLAWIQLARVPPHVYFSHRRHVAMAKLACATCHGPMEKLTAPPTKPFREFTMDACIQCHQQNRARTDCNDCHR
jgi:predicted CXXCH cytochrome family protein